jgi:hypothetical protein
MTSGWTFHRAGVIDVAVHTVDHDGRQIIDEMVIAGDGIGTADLRSIPVGRYEASANATGGVSAVIQEYLDEHPEMVPSSPVLTLEDIRNTFAARRAATPTVAGAGREPVRRPSTSPYPDSFYAAVAKAYREFMASDRAPAARLAEEAEVPVRTVHTWVQEARRRGHLPKGQQGKVG